MAVKTKLKMGFTLIELLVVIAIVAALAVAVVLTLSPVDLLRQARDSSRLSDLTTLHFALASLQASDAGNMGSSSVVYVSLPDSSSSCSNLGLPILPTGWTYSCRSTTTYMKADGTGWIPANFAHVDAGNPLSRLPIDPTNSSSSGLYYAYVTDGTSYHLTAMPESTKMKMGGSGSITDSDGGWYPEMIEKGTNLTLLPVARDETLLAYWNMNEAAGTVAYDASGNGFNGAAIGSVARGAAGVRGNAAQLNGGYFTTTFTQALGNYTAAAWFNTENVVTNIGRVFNKDQATCFGIYRNGTTTTWYARNMSTTISSPALAEGFWHHFALVRNGNTMTFYVDGIAAGSAVYGSTCSTNAMFLGAEYAGGNLFRGLLDEIRVYNRALTSTEVSALYSGSR